MVSGKINVSDTSGLHLTPAKRLCDEAIKYKSKITMRFNNVDANAKSVLSVLSACVKCEDEIEFICEGEDEALALENVIKAVKESQK